MGKATWFKASLLEANGLRGSYALSVMITMRQADAFRRPLIGKVQKFLDHVNHLEHVTLRGSGRSMPKE